MTYPFKVGETYPHKYHPSNMMRVVGAVGTVGYAAFLGGKDGSELSTAAYAFDMRTGEGRLSGFGLVPPEPKIVVSEGAWGEYLGAGGGRRGLHDAFPIIARDNGYVRERKE